MTSGSSGRETHSQRHVRVNGVAVVPGADRAGQKRLTRSSFAVFLAIPMSISSVY